MVDYNNYGGGGDHQGSSDTPSSPIRSYKLKIDMPGGLVGVGVFSLMLILGFIVLVNGGNAWLLALSIPLSIVTAVVFDRWNTVYD
ncbi:MAG: hypothetical protein Greene071421_291 [Parcubacteria group bacterium Greene0714_21]|nr:MAG: hypothetical protein Greene041639_565 [Parcubacteria group bacterium Greene0416_39]TSC97582.1 MAG: hypothetical protein Greene101447_436 [Parcubacteria group bacterium Greene1014_47]TSD04455.1 MAG: hypothetical protein Greene071421_291 [Parcubacteria group bacterium Greene0714_21]